MKRNRKQQNAALESIGRVLVERVADLEAIRPAGEDDDEIKAYLQRLDEALASLLRGIDENDAAIAALLRGVDENDAAIAALLQRRTE